MNLGWMEKITKSNKPHRGDPTGKSKVKSVYFNFLSGDYTWWNVMIGQKKWTFGTILESL